MILLDTHVVAWLALEPSRLSQAAVHAVENSRDAEGIAISPVTLFELAYMVERHRIEIDTTSESFLHDIASKPLCYETFERVHCDCIRKVY